MKHFWVVMAALMVIATARGQERYKADAGPLAVERRDETWRDAARAREVPVRIYLPKAAREMPQGEGGAGDTRPGKYPLIVYSHGLGGSRNVGAYLANHLASHGYIVISPTHAGSDAQAVRKEARERIRDRVRDRERPDNAQEAKTRQEQLEFLKESTSDPDNLRHRPRDVTFVIDEALRNERLSPMTDRDRIGVMGHSFGAYTGFAVAGMTIDLPEGEDGGAGKSFRDARVKAVVAMSPQGVGAMGITGSSWDKVAVPVLSLTGTKDYGQGQRAAAWRREAFDSTKGVEAMLVVIRDATHMTFSDNAGAGLTGSETSKDHDKHIMYIKMVTTAYFDAHVRGDQAAAAWLSSGELGKFDGGACAVERK